MLVLYAAVTGWLCAGDTVVVNTVVLTMSSVSEILVGLEDSITEAVVALILYTVRISSVVCSSILSVYDDLVVVISPDPMPELTNALTELTNPLSALVLLRKGVLVVKGRVAEAMLSTESTLD